MALHFKKRPKLKYRNEPTEIDGHKFASKKEGARYAVLKLREQMGEIKGLKLQPKYWFPIYGVELEYQSKRRVVYIADFSYWNMKKQALIVEDVKGVQTPMFKLKWALMKACHDIEVKIT